MYYSASHVPTGSYLRYIYQRPGHCIPSGGTVTEKRITIINGMPFLMLRRDVDHK